MAAPEDASADLARFWARTASCSVVIVSAATMALSASSIDFSDVARVWAALLRRLSVFSVPVTSSLAISQTLALEVSIVLFAASIVFTAAVATPRAIFLWVSFVAVLARSAAFSAVLVALSAIFNAWSFCSFVSLAVAIPASSPFRVSRIRTISALMDSLVAAT